MCWAHEDVVGHFAEGKSQVDNVVLRAAALREVTDVHDASGTRFTLKKLRKDTRDEITYIIICNIVKYWIHQQYVDEICVDI